MEGEPTYDAAMNHAEAFSLEESYDAFPRIEAEFEGALDASLGPRGPELLYELVQGLHLAPRANVLDVGCGEGRHSLALAERFGFSVHGVDPVPRHIELSTERLDAAAARRPELRELVRFHRGSTESLPLEDRTIDLIWCRDVLVHVFALETAFTEWRRVLRDDGRAIVFQTLATDRLEPREAAWPFAALGIAVGSTDPKRVDESIAAGGLHEAARAGADVVILDTAGRLHVDEELMDELVRLKRSLAVTETLLVADAMTGQDAVKLGEAFGQKIGLDGVILTKLDGDSRGGAALSLRLATGQSIRFAGTGEKPADLEIFQAERVASRILGMGDVLSLIEKAESAVDRQQAAEVERRLRAGQLSFDDFLTQIRQLRSMGSLEGVLDMLPGGAALKAQVGGQDTEKEMGRMEAIILSMTPRERARPELIDGARKRRIARGSGTQPSDVNRVLKARDAMQKLARQMGRQPKQRGLAGTRRAAPRLFGQGGGNW